MSDHVYRGTELDLFSHAVNWKRYIASFARSHLQGYVLEVGAGIGSNTLLLHSPANSKWLCLEPDAGLYRRLLHTIKSLNSLAPVQAIQGTIDCLSRYVLFDSVVYWDVLEHIDDDSGELQNAVNHLRTGGKMIVVVPAYQWLYSSFDANIGHFRRYSKSGFRKKLAGICGLEIVKLIYLDSIGIVLNAVNRFFMKQKNPTLNQIRLWNNVVIPLSRIVDPMVGNSFGKSLLLIARKKQ